MRTSRCANVETKGRQIEIIPFRVLFSKACIPLSVVFAFLLTGLVAPAALAEDTASPKQTSSPEEDVSPKQESSPAPSESPDESPTNLVQPSVLVYETADGAFSYQLHGRIYLDAAVYQENKNPMSNGAEARSARLGIKTKLWNDWKTELEFDLADNEDDTNQVDIKDVWISYAKSESSLLKIGNFKEPFSLEELTHSSDIVFMERALPNALAPGRHLGVGYNRWGSGWQFGIGIFGEEAGNKNVDSRENHGQGVSARVTMTPVLSDEQVLHLGVAVSRRTPNADLDTMTTIKQNTIRFSSQPETHVNETRYVDTGRIINVDRYQLFGAELAWTCHAYTFQAEHISAYVDQKGNTPDPEFDGNYIQLSWFSTGESRPYVPHEGKFGQFLPKKDTRAWELAIRFSSLNLNDSNAGISGGKQKITTFGANRYINSNLRIMFNYAFVKNDASANANAGTLVTGNDKFEYFQTRFQATF